MNTPFETPKPTSSTNKPLWAAVGVLGVAVLAMGAALVRIQTKPEEPRLAVLTASAPAPVASASSSSLPVALPEKTPPSIQKQAVAPVKHAQTAPKHIATPARPVELQAPNGVAQAPVAVQVPRPICANCGTVVAVTPIQRDGTGGGGGAIAGGVLGALLGNQVGGGDGKSIATVLGAVGGGFAGNAIEKKMKKETVYEVQVRMEDGSSRTVEQATPVSVGAKVTVVGNTLQAASRY